MDLMKKTRIVNRKAFHRCNVKPLTADECGLDSPEMRQFVKEQEALAESREHFFATVDLSQYGSKVGCSSENLKKLYKLKREVIDLKKRVETHMKIHNAHKDSKKLLFDLQKVIYFVTRYPTITADLPFDWIKKRFLPDDMRGFKILYPDVESDNQLMAAEQEPEYIWSDDDECETVNGSETVEEPLKDPDFSRLDRLDLGNSRRSLYLYLPIGLGMPDSHNNDEQKICLELNKWASEDEVIYFDYFNEERLSIDANHPIVSVVGNFAVAAFNKACEKHVKKGEHNNLYDFEIMECKYSKVFHFYHFYMIIEAVEENNVGTYMAEVACDISNTTSILWKFVLTDYKPSGTKAMAASYLSCLNSICQTMEAIREEKLDRLSSLLGSLKDPERRKVIYESHRLKHNHAKVWEGLHAKLNEHTRFHFPPDCNRRTHPALWSDPGKDCCSGMVRRAKGTTCRGYDYYNPLLMDQDPSQSLSFLTWGERS